MLLCQFGTHNGVFVVVIVACTHSCVFSLINDPLQERCGTDNRMEMGTVETQAQPRLQSGCAAARLGTKSGVRMQCPSLAPRLLSSCSPASSFLSIVQQSPNILLLAAGFRMFENITVIFSLPQQTPTGTSHQTNTPQQLLVFVGVCWGSVTWPEAYRSCFSEGGVASAGGGGRDEG